MTRRPSPDVFPSGPFTVAEALRHGISAERLRASDLDKPFWGIRSTTTATELAARCRAFALRMPPDGTYSHSTAALLHGIPLGRRLERSPELHVTVPATRRAVDARDIRGHSAELPESDADRRHGISATVPERTWCDLSTQLDLPDLVAAGDFLLFHESPLTTPGRLAAAVDRQGSRRGIRLLRQALPLLSDRAESRRESQLRMLLLSRGFPPPSVNHVVFDERGREIARIDLAYPRLRIAIEYEGDHHRTEKEQWHRDIRRTRDLESRGWVVLRVTLADLLSPSEFLAALTRSIESRTSGR